MGEKYRSVLQPGGNHRVKRGANDARAAGAAEDPNLMAGSRADLRSTFIIATGTTGPIRMGAGSLIAAGAGWRSTRASSLCLYFRHLSLYYITPQYLK